MPKRVIDFDAMWASDKLAACAEWAQAEYAWLYGLADCAGCFELTNLRVIWGRVAAIRRNFSIERLEQVIDEFHDKRLLFIWTANGKRYGHWTGSDVPGRLPPPSWRNRLERLAPPVPREQLEMFLAVGEQSIGTNTTGQEPGSSGSAISSRPETEISREFSFVDKKSLKPHLEPVQGQDLDLDLRGKWSEETHTSCFESAQRPETLRSVCENSAPPFEKDKPKGPCLEKDSNLEAEKADTQHANGKWSVAQVSAPQSGDKPEAVASDRHAENQTNSSANISQNPQVPAKTAGDLSYKGVPSPEALAEIWEQERGPLSEMRGLTPERIARCRERIRNAADAAQFVAEFREAVRRAAATPFLCGEGPGGWRANFDWIVANDTNYLKVLEGRYDAGSSGNSRDTAYGNTSAARDNWSAQSASRDESARRMARAGAGPETPPSVRVRSDVLHRATHRA